MGTGWRRAFCTSIPRDPENAAAPPPEKQQHHRRLRQQQLSPTSSPPNQNHSPRSCIKFGLFAGGGGSSNPSMLRLRCRTAAASSVPPLLSPSLDAVSSRRCKTASFSEPYTPPAASSASAAAPAVKSSSRLLLTRSNPASPRSPSRFALLKATLCLSRSRCGICSQSVRAGQRTAVFTAECSHSFHFLCISSHVRSQSSSTNRNTLICPVCSSPWREVPLLSSLHSQPPSPPPPFNICDDAKAAIHRNLSSGCKQPLPPPPPSSKIYDDDEPLQISSARHGGSALHFNPIPEADLEDDAEGSRPQEPAGGLCVEVSVMPEAALVSSDRNHHNYVVLLRVNAPALPQRSMSKVAASVLDPSCRAPIDLVTVLDVSGSMTPEKLQMLKTAMRLLISSLGSSDRLSIVAFSADSKRLLPLVRMSRQGQRSARQIVDRLIVSAAAGGQDDCRCIGHALRKATKVLQDRRARNPVATIMLLSDSPQEHQRLRDNEMLQIEARHLLRTPVPSSLTETVARRFAHLEIPIGCSSELRSVAGAVNNQVEDVFSKCVSGLVSVVMQDVHLQLTFPSGFISAIYSAGGEACFGPVVPQLEGKIVSLNLGDFYAAEKRELLVELKLPATTGPQNQRHCLYLHQKCSFRDPTTREHVLCREKSLLLPPLRQISSTAQPPASACELRNLFITTRALVESRRLVDVNDISTALHLLSTARSLLLQSNTPNSHNHNFVGSIDSRLSELHRRHIRRPQRPLSSSSTPRSEQLTPTSAWRAAEQLAKVAIQRKSLSRVGDLHGFENARF